MVCLLAVGRVATARRIRECSIAVTACPVCTPPADASRRPPVAPGCSVVTGPVPFVVRCSEFAGAWPSEWGAEFCSIVWVTRVRACSASFLVMRPLGPVPVTSCRTVQQDTTGLGLRRRAVRRVSCPGVGRVRGRFRGRLDGRLGRQRGVIDVGVVRYAIPRLSRRPLGSSSRSIRLPASQVLRTTPASGRRS